MADRCSGCLSSTEQPTPSGIHIGRSEIRVSAEDVRNAEQAQRMLDSTTDGAERARIARALVAATEKVNRDVTRAAQAQRSASNPDGTLRR
jgi:hypothetical protein